jgi:hypothetical protein
MVATPTPATCLRTAGNGSQKCVWTAPELGRAAGLDWNVEGATYGIYQAITGTPPLVPPGTPFVILCGATNLGMTLAIGAWSNIDADALNGTVCMWRDQINADGTVAAVAPNCPANLAPAPDLALCPGAARPGTIGSGQVAGCSADNIF